MTTQIPPGNSPDIPERPSPSSRTPPYPPTVPGTSLPVFPDNAPAPAEHGALRTGAHYASLVLSAMLGTLIRLGFNALGAYDGRVIFPLAWAQGVGCGIMGLGTARKNQLNWIYPPLVTFITTGIAGSTTTFSSWMLEGYEAFANHAHARRGGLYDTVDGFAYSLATFGISYAGVVLGDHVSSLLPTLPRPRAAIRTALALKEDPYSVRRGARVHSPTPLLDLFMFVLAFASYGAALAMYFAAPRTWRHRAVFSLLLAPPGAIIRYALSKLNTRTPWFQRFPVGTFIANIAATMLISGVFAGQRRPAVSGATTTCDALYALQDGFCGCLSTVSTFVVEARTIQRWYWAWFYVLGSVILGHVLVMGIVGGTGWTLGYVAVCKGSDP